MPRKNKDLRELHRRTKRGGSGVTAAVALGGSWRHLIAPEQLPPSEVFLGRRLEGEEFFRALGKAVARHDVSFKPFTVPAVRLLGQGALLEIVGGWEALPRRPRPGMVGEYYVHELPNAIREGFPADHDRPVLFLDNPGFRVGSRAGGTLNLTMPMSRVPEQLGREATHLRTDAPQKIRLGSFEGGDPSLAFVGELRGILRSREEGPSQLGPVRLYMIGGSDSGS